MLRYLFVGSSLYQSQFDHAYSILQQDLHKKYDNGRKP